MAPLDLNATMDAIGVRLTAIANLRVQDYPADFAAPPAAIVGLPSEVAYDFTKGRGSDRAVIPVAVLVGKLSDRAARDDLSGYLAGSGAKSVKAAVDGTLNGTVQSARTVGARTDVITLNGVDYLGATFDVEVVS